MRAMVSPSVMLPSTMIASGRSCFRAASRSADTSVAITRAPSAMSRIAVAFPMPEPAPVTMCVVPSNRADAVVVMTTSPPAMPRHRERRRSREPGRTFGPASPREVG
jgi:hypothetical protein